jgi:hypothetical protein
MGRSFEDSGFEKSAELQRGVSDSAGEVPEPLLEIMRQDSASLDDLPNDCLSPYLKTCQNSLQSRGYQQERRAIMPKPWMRSKLSKTSSTRMTAQ